MLAAVAWGDNPQGGLATGWKGGGIVKTPELVIANAVPKQIIPAYYSIYTRMGDMGVQSAGGNDFWELLSGDRLERAHLGPAKGLHEVTKLAISGAHGLALLKSSAIATWGGNDFGTIGNGTNAGGLERGVEHVILPGLTGVKDVAAGGCMCAAIMLDGSLMTWGENKQGQLGLGMVSLLIDRPTKVGNLRSPVVEVSINGLGSHGGHMLVRCSDGTVWACGGNNHGQLGDGTTKNTSFLVQVGMPTSHGPVVELAAGINHSLARTADGTVWGWGGNDKGQLGLSPPLIPRAILPTPLLTGCSKIAASLWTSGVIQGGIILTTGLNQYGVLGDGTIEDKHAWTSAGLKEVVDLTIGEYSAAALTNGPVPKSTLSCTSLAGSLVPHWNWEDKPRWIVEWRKRAHPILPREGSIEIHDPKARSFTIPKLLKGVPYEVSVEAPSFGKRTITATPL